MSELFTPPSTSRKRRASVSVDELRASLLESPTSSSPFTSIVTKKLSLDPTASFNSDIDFDPELPPSVLTTEYDSHLLSLPLNILLSTRLSPYNSVATKRYPMASLGDTKRLFYPDYKCFQHLIDAIVSEFALPNRTAIKSFKVKAKKRGEIVVDREVSGEGQWEGVLREMRVRGVGSMGGGVRGAETVKLIVKLETGS